MIINKYGITLSRLTEVDIELVRQMRNKQSIRSKMFYQREITTEEQIEWFKSIDNSHYYYFIISYQGKKIGLINGKVVSYEERIGEGGLFIWDDHYYSTHFPVIASVCLADLTFLIMKMDVTLADVRSDNKVAIDYNARLGYQVIFEDEEEGRIKMSLHRDKYFAQAKKIREGVKQISKDYSDLSWDDLTFTESDKDSHLYHNLPDYLQSEVERKFKAL